MGIMSNGHLVVYTFCRMGILSYRYFVGWAFCIFAILSCRHFDDILRLMNFSLDHSVFPNR
ncbi:unnamed protein product [Meloidogyne enterolobii]|uniref:Uncharacterized protein n=1 Tax=Meloidogyne enterolobii TaxID=390850 RepID=A0ACB0YYP0_MELEN